VADHVLWVHGYYFVAIFPVILYRTQYLT